MKDGGRNIMYTIVALLPRSLVTALEPHRQRYDPQANIIPPHITVVGPFNFSGPLQELYDHLDEIGETHAPIKVSLIGWDAYNQTDYQIHLPLVTGRLEFKALHKNLLTGPLSHLKPDETYWPHITLGRFSKQFDLEQAKKALRGFEPQFTFSVTHLELLYRNKPTQPWQTQKQFNLEATVLSLPRNREFVRIS
jgi:2'-5' RNA ligase